MDSVTLNSVAVSHLSDQQDVDVADPYDSPLRSSDRDSPGFSFLSEPPYVEAPMLSSPGVLVAASPVRQSPVGSSPPAVVGLPSSPAPDLGPLPPLVLASSSSPAVHRHQIASPVASGPSLLEVAYQAALLDTAPVGQIGTYFAHLGGV